MVVKNPFNPINPLSLLPPVLYRLIIVAALTSSVVITATGIATLVARIRTTTILRGWGSSVTLYQLLDVDKLGLLQEFAARDVVLSLLLGQESDVECLYALVCLEILLLQNTARLALHGAVEASLTLRRSKSKVTGK